MGPMGFKVKQIFKRQAFNGLKEEKKRTCAHPSGN
jgi:hypothetical protein